ncbi:MAG: peptide deformylase [Sarcina sp.]
MAIRTIRVDEDSILRKVSKEVKDITPRIEILIKDMIDTMYESNGVGLAAVQVGVLKRIFVVDIQDGFGYRIFINPEIIDKKGSQIGQEGCLSLPGQIDDVERANEIIIKALNEKGEEFVLEANEFLARAIQHENDHLNGILFKDHVK